MYLFVKIIYINIYILHTPRLGAVIETATPGADSKLRQQHSKNLLSTNIVTFIIRFRGTNTTI